MGGVGAVLVAALLLYAATRPDTFRVERSHGNAWQAKGARHQVHAPSSVSNSFA